jgi:hypothetical protein
VPITSSIIFSTQESVTRYNLPPTTPGVFTNLSLPLAFASLNATAGGLLRSQNRLDTQQKLNYIFANKQHQVGFETFYSLVNFQSLGTYVAIMPTGTWALRRSSALQMDARLGILRSWLNPYPGVFERAQNMPVFELITTQGLNTIGLPRWSFSGELSQMPFYDVVTGLLVPRASITLQLTWAPISRFSWQFSVRDFTPKLWFFTDNILPHGYTKNILVAGTQANYKINRYVSLNSGASTNISWVSRSTTLGYDHNKQIFAYVGIESLYDIR